MPEVTGFSWTVLPEQKDTTPSVRIYFSMVTDGDKLYVFGGFDQRKKARFNDIQVYNPVTHRWDAITAGGDIPRPVNFHAATAYQRKMYVFGGDVGGKEINDFFSIELDSTSPRWTKIESKSVAPAPRYGHALATVGDNLVLVGGTCQGKYLDTVQLFSPATATWTTLASLPSPSAFHSLAEYQGKLVCYGGYSGTENIGKVFFYDFGSNRWQTLATDASPRIACGMSVYGDYLYAFGGFTQAGHSNELNRLNLKSLAWEAVRTPSSPVSRSYLHAAIMKGRFYIYGGFDGSASVNDLRCLVLDQTSTTSSASSSSSSTYSIAPSAPSPVPTDPSDNYVNILMTGTADSSISRAAESIMRRHGVDGLLFADGLLRLLGDFRKQLTQYVERTVAEEAKTSIPFDPKLVMRYVDYGFGREDVVATLEKLQKQGKDVENINIVVEALLAVGESSATSAPTPPPAVPPAPAVRQPSVTGLQTTIQGLEQQIADRDELKKCKICFENDIGCVFKDCGHLSVCMGCASSLRECPMCRKEIKGLMRIFW